MKRFLFLVMTVLGLVVSFAASAETIRNFAVTAQLSADRTLTVDENISYDFGDHDRHGIYRDIPIRYQRSGGSYLLRLNVLDVKRDDTAESHAETTEDGTLRIKIGEADRTITGPHAFGIRYSTDRAINFFPDHSELYWNVTGNEWEVPMEQASFTIQVPAGSKGPIPPACFTGSVGSNEHACTITETTDGYRITSDRVLLPTEGMTVVFAFKPGAIRAPTLFDRLWQILADNMVLFVPLFALLYMHWRWMTKGKDPAKRTVIAEYDPPRKLAPALVGAAEVDGEAPKRTVTATIIDLARRGYLHIRFNEEKKLIGSKRTYTFVKKRDADEALAPFEREIVQGLFADGDEQTIEDLKDGKFYVRVRAFLKELETEIGRMGVFVTNPTFVRGAYFAAAVVLVTVLNFFSRNELSTMAFIATGVIVALYGWFMPRRTLDGVKLLAEVQGFKLFLSVTEKARLDFTDAPERTPEQFQKFLPYAIALAVEEKWAAQFASLTLSQPEWAEGNIGTFHAVSFANSLSDLNRTATSNAFSPPSQAGSGGSGFSGGGSGGGFGGGGGGSW